MKQIYLSLILTFTALALSVGPARAEFEIRCIQSLGRTYLYLSDIAAYYGMNFTTNQKSAVLSSRYSHLYFTPDRKKSEINDVMVYLAFAPTLVDGNPLLSEPDFKLLLDPVLRKRALPRDSLQRIVLDPGHGGKDNGAAGERLLEKDLVLDIARRLAVRFRKCGYAVALTRDRDRAVTLEDRPRVAGRWHADLFLSIHANYVSDSSVSGAETFLLPPENTPSTYGTSMNTFSCSGNRFDKQNARAAYEIQKQFQKATHCVDRGIKHAQFLVLREAPCPAVLVEMGFLSNPEEERLFTTPGYRQRIVTGILNGVIRYHRSLTGR